MTQTTTDKTNNRKNQSPVHARPLKLWQDQSHEKEVHIEIVPLIDVIFCILTFFILGAVGLSRQQAISLDLPKAGTGTPQMREMLVVSLDDFGQVYLEKQPVTRNQLFDAIKNYHQFNPNGIMALHASRNASYNEVIQVLDILKQVGGDRVALATLPGSSDSSNNWSTPPNVPSSPTTVPGFPGNPSNSWPSTTPTNPSQGVGTSPGSGVNPSLPSLPNSPQTAPPN
ncbi:Biopolymer transport protein ExbD/TolR [Rippkaea orientalis PCC 8801]|uniref:Biopolymer transport protein ExbD/TolR n=1 Tax=Rippkaea orientalis (strain PCC 8801 / RF-1) TaxID=41431 RepID=B7JYD2_RIPO1|nr:biopolymer transporter ExbD [Rippkaea orientalis]ACK67234.1 Biopolymer transport protein ExbD/TolR [Rippkaea orientalis PCC 8801]